MLVFGAIRSDQEKQLILDTFGAIELPGKFLVASSWRENSRTQKPGLLGKLKRLVKRAGARLTGDSLFHYGYVADEDTQIYLNSADVLFIPRLQLLNSANVSLGMTFGTVVVGPDAGNAGEILRATGNPVFDPSRTESAVSATLEGFRLAAAGVRGPANRSYALAQWPVEKCAERYVEFFSAVRA
jgi:glycosyltransferase involved in cell wall biosynthesis